MPHRRRRCKSQGDTTTTNLPDHLPELQCLLCSASDHCTVQCSSFALFSTETLNRLDTDCSFCIQISSCEEIPGQLVTRIQLCDIHRSKSDDVIPELSFPFQPLCDLEGIKVLDFKMDTAPEAQQSDPVIQIDLETTTTTGELKDLPDIKNSTGDLENLPTFLNSTGGIPKDPTDRVVVESLLGKRKWRVSKAENYISQYVEILEAWKLAEEQNVERKTRRNTIKQLGLKKTKFYQIKAIAEAALVDMDFIDGLFADPNNTIADVQKGASIFLRAEKLKKEKAARMVEEGGVEGVIQPGPAAESLVPNDDIIEVQSGNPLIPDPLKTEAIATMISNGTNQSNFQGHSTVNIMGYSQSDNTVSQLGCLRRIDFDPGPKKRIRRAQAKSEQYVTKYLGIVNNWKIAEHEMQQEAGRTSAVGVIKRLGLKKTTFYQIKTIAEAALVNLDYVENLFCDQTLSLVGLQKKAADYLKTDEAKGVLADLKVIGVVL